MQRGQRVRRHRCALVVILDSATLGGMLLVLSWQLLERTGAADVIMGVLGG
jgi:hypothetical protein